MNVATQNSVIRRTCHELGIVPRFPKCQCKGNIDRPVLIYRFEDAKFNDALDSEAAANNLPTPAPERYKPYIFSFENTDADGRFRLCFGNHGTIDLRRNGAERLAGAIRLAFYRSELIRYAAYCGGVLQIKEADNYNNDLNRNVVAALRQKYGVAYLGKVTYPTIKEQYEVALGARPVFEKWDCKTIYNASCDFVVPEEDATLESLIRKWNSNPGISQMGLLTDIMDRIEELDGFYFVWK